MTIVKKGGYLPMITNYKKNKRGNELEATLENIAKAIFVVNKHAKTAPSPKFLYLLKRRSLEKLIQNGQAKKIGLHFSRNPRNCQQISSVVVSCGDYLFHIPPMKQDFKDLPHLGNLNDHTRNPKTQLSLTLAKRLLMDFTGIEEPNDNKKHQQYFYQRGKNYFQHSKPVFKRLGERY